MVWEESTDTRFLLKCRRSCLKFGILFEFSNLRRFFGPVGAPRELVRYASEFEVCCYVSANSSFLPSCVQREFVTFVVFRAFVCSAEINKRQMTAAAGFSRQQQQFQYIEVLLLLRSFPKQGGHSFSDRSRRHVHPKIINLGEEWGGHTMHMCSFPMRSCSSHATYLSENNQNMVPSSLSRGLVFLLLTSANTESEVIYLGHSQRMGPNANE